ncbi:MAG: hypothetical protein P1U61_02625 [Legionellaceae bacterium]|nr:hypothetical protein [Legionellaceae bacterium]
MSHDVAWHILITERLLQGGHYTQNFMDISPPLIMYSKIPAAYLMHSLKLPMPTALRLYMFIISLYSLILCYQVLHAQQEKNIFFQKTLITALSFCFFCLPLYEFGQRDNLIMVLIMPYFLTFSNYPSQTHLPLKLRILTSIFAGIGFLIHLPYFLILMLLESYFFYKKRTQRILEMTIIFLIATFYLSSIIIFFPDYLNVVLPLVLYCYVDIYNNQWINMFFGTWTVIGCYFALFAFFITKKIIHPDFFLKMLVLLLILFFMPYILTKKLWFYHKLPVLTFTILLLTTLLAHVSKTQNRLAIYFIISLFVFPALEFTTVLQQSLALKQQNSPLSQVINYVQKKYSHDNIYVFSATMWPQLLIPYAHVNTASRFAPTWLPLAIMQKQTEDLSPSNMKKLSEIKHFLFKTMSEDLEKYQPSLILVDDNVPDLHTDSPFNFIDFFQQDSRFSKIWLNYELSGSLFNCRIYTRRQPDKSHVKNDM